MAVGSPHILLTSPQHFEGFCNISFQAHLGRRAEKGTGPASVWSAKSAGLCAPAISALPPRTQGSVGPCPVTSHPELFLSREPQPAHHVFPDPQLVARPPCLYSPRPSPVSRLPALLPWGNGRHVQLPYLFQLLDGKSSTNHLFVSQVSSIHLPP